MASKHQPSMEPAEVQDAIALLTADHKRVARLFVQFEALKEEGSDEAKSALVAQICEELTVHTAVEEEIFYPAVRHATGDGDLVDEAVVEHLGAKDLIAQLQAAHPDDDLYDAKVTVLGEQIEHHVSEEEGSMFPQARAAGVDTVSLGAEMLARKAQVAAGVATAGPVTPAPSKLQSKPKRDASSSENTVRATLKKKTSKKNR